MTIGQVWGIFILASNNWRGKTLIQTSFLVPIKEDAGVGNGDLHPHTRWEHFDIELWNTFGAYTKAPGLYDGAYQDPDTQEKVCDQSRKYIMALEKRDLSKMRHFLKEVVGPLFRQKCIYFEIKGEVEYVFSNLKKIGLFP